MNTSDPIYDLVIIGGGINGCGIARDAAGRGLSVLLCEKDDLAQATSSASTKLFHGGLRYLEYFEFGLVRKALKEREVLLRNMPHISWPMRFVLPYDPEQRMPAWLVRLGLFVYDHLGGRRILPATRTLDLRTDSAGVPLKPLFRKAFEYSDCWVNDARLVVLNARDAAKNGAHICTRTTCVAAHREQDLWHVVLQNDATRTVRAKAVINAGGPWVDEILNGRLRQNSTASIRLVRGSHIVVKKLFDHDQPYFFQLRDGRIIFAIPYETDFTLVGTTDQDHDGDPKTAHCTPEEQTYLIDAINRFFNRQIDDSDVVWTYSGVRPLYDDGGDDATSATRDYVLGLQDTDGKAPLLNVFGGKITTYRKLAQETLAKLAPYFPHLPGDWTENAPLPGGDFPVDGVDRLTGDLRRNYPFLDASWALRLVRSYGTLALEIYGNAMTIDDLGQDFGASLFQREVTWLIDKEWAQTTDDILWRRSKLGLRLTPDQVAALASALAKDDVDINA